MTLYRCLTHKNGLVTNSVQTYQPDSLKVTTRENRGKGTRRKVLPIYFASFLQDTTNKEELFNLPTEDVVKHDYPPSKHVYITSGSHVTSNCVNISMSANDQHKTDSRICLYVDDALNEGELLFSSEP